MTMLMCEYAAVAGSYGITAYTDTKLPSVNRCARDILILKRDGHYTVNLAVLRVTGGKDAGESGWAGTYCFVDDRTLLLTSDDCGDAMLGHVGESGVIVLESVPENGQVQDRWLARKIDCIWPNCRTCFGNLWHYCVRSSW